MTEHLFSDDRVECQEEDEGGGDYGDQDVHYYFTRGQGFGTKTYVKTLRWV